MNPPIIAFFNNKGGVGKTTLVYHLAWMYADSGKKVIAVDLDPQSNLSAAFLDEDRLDEIWLDGDHSGTVFGAIEPLKEGFGDVREPAIETIEENLDLLVGDLSLSSFEDDLSDSWPNCLDGRARAFRVISAFWTLMQKAMEKCNAAVVLVDLGPNLGAINRAALIAADYVVVPLSPDLFSLIGLQNLGPTLRQWRKDWEERLKKNPDKNLKLPQGEMRPTGFIVQQHSERLDRPVKAYERWINRIPEVYEKDVLGEPTSKEILGLQNNPHCLALLKHYRSLMPLAQEARKPIFKLKPADGAIGSHTQNVQDAFRTFNCLARKIAKVTGIKEAG